MILYVWIVSAVHLMRVVTIRVDGRVVYKWLLEVVSVPLTHLMQVVMYLWCKVGVEESSMVRQSVETLEQRGDFVVPDPVFVFAGRSLWEFSVGRKAKRRELNLVMG